MRQEIYNKSAMRMSLECFKPAVTSFMQVHYGLGRDDLTVENWAVAWFMAGGDAWHFSETLASKFDLKRIDEASE